MSLARRLLTESGPSISSINNSVPAGRKPIDLSAKKRRPPVTFLPFQTLTFEDLSMGMTETSAKEVKSSDVVGFAEITGDRNPVHLS